MKEFDPEESPRVGMGGEWEVGDDCDQGGGAVFRRAETCHGTLSIGSFHEWRKEGDLIRRSYFSLS